ncbi:ABC transporter ATP-binding protein [Desulforamulus aeronauticus]|uniref:ABC-2 type transport system ATP-binding protein n=1 Tax=Desulforamulus aeronauticus DSM 10349 TaxID=1121421 RepID=A0A1M6TCZ9_9FIRM|nr:ATP-binding cassette domain-containing protein [Desulforamulus aeronauticus]SHK54833.1 ABC-2 type transport system ATP-binding protein [Desulforamulus aeronauticus DSM 10349]
MGLIEVNHLSKHYQIAKRQEGLGGALRSLFHREYMTKMAVQDISFAVNRGEVVGYIGPNGAGKSTTIKMLTGILVPTSGEIRVNGIIPFKERQKNARQIGVVFGQRTQLWWDLPTIESFELLKQVFEVPDQRYRQNMATFSDILGLGEFLYTPVRQLSLGQRMRADIAASLLHDPVILFLDEPTIGLDVVAKERMRTFIKEINRERGVTVILTTHDMSDIEKLCQRMILIDKGRVMYDGELAKIKERFGKERVLIVDLEGEATDFSIAGAAVIKQEGNRMWLRFSRDEVTASQLINQISEKYEIKDVTIKDPEIDVMIRHIYEKGMDGQADYQQE